MTSINSNPTGAYLGITQSGVTQIAPDYIQQFNDSQVITISTIHTNEITLAKSIGRVYSFSPTSFIVSLLLLVFNSVNLLSYVAFDRYFYFHPLISLGFIIMALFMFLTMHVGINK